MIRGEISHCGIKPSLEEKATQPHKHDGTFAMHSGTCRHCRHEQENDQYNTNFHVKVLRHFLVKAENVLPILDVLNSSQEVLQVSELWRLVSTATQRDDSEAGESSPGGHLWSCEFVVIMLTAVRVKHLDNKHVLLPGPAGLDQRQVRGGNSRPDSEA